MDEIELKKLVAIQESDLKEVREVLKSTPSLEVTVSRYLLERCEVNLQILIELGKK